MLDENPELELFYELSCYTQFHRDSSFIHQYAIDAFTTQTADVKTKPLQSHFFGWPIPTHRKEFFRQRGTKYPCRAWKIS